MPLEALVIVAAGAGFLYLRARLRPMVTCRRCAGTGCPRCRFAGVRIRPTARLAHRRSR